MDVKIYQRWDRRWGKKLLGVNPSLIARHWISATISQVDIKVSKCIELSSKKIKLNTSWPTYAPDKWGQRSNSITYQSFFSSTSSASAPFCRVSKHTPHTETHSAVLQPHFMVWQLAVHIELLQILLSGAIHCHNFALPSNSPPAIWNITTFNWAIWLVKSNSHGTRDKIDLDRLQPTEMQQHNLLP